MSALSIYDYPQQKAISGLSLAHRRLDVPGRKQLVSELASGRVILTPMTTTQASVVLGVSPYAVFADRYRRKLVASPALQPGDHGGDLADAELDSVIERFGPARVWDRLSAAIS